MRRAIKLQGWVQHTCLGQHDRDVNDGGGRPRLSLPMTRQSSRRIADSRADYLRSAYRGAPERTQPPSRTGRTQDLGVDSL
jgi:hypothetical protein